MAAAVAQRARVVEDGGPRRLHRLGAAAPTAARCLARVRRWGRAWWRDAPGTAVYLIILATTSVTLQGTSPRLTERLLISVSTNLDNVSHRPVQVLVSSALWVDRSWTGLLAVVGLALLLGPSERWFGTWRTAVVYIVGHSVATLTTVLVLHARIVAGSADPSLASMTDVGVSYGLAAVVGLWTYRLRGSTMRALWLSVFVGTLGAAAVIGGDSTDLGHLIGLVCGLVLGWFVGRQVPEPDRTGTDRTTLTATTR
jgi:membrane associated rhomboid family serine protease